ncbi:hypothetical protein AB0M28_02355 [Streptomyces sp. NPDC051940]|uniref:hypothetical protein n=1 Tax=Streptomyces sp. NPDC051940 TaxID=3155675 RepID=UPI00341C865A
MAEAADDDAFYVLTAALLTPAKFPAVLGDDYPAVCAELGLLSHEAGYGLVFGQDAAGARWTVVVDDASLVAVALATWDVGMEHELTPDERSIIDTLPGWPLALAIAAPDLPAPHDPADADRPVLSPPDMAEWGPAQRRLGADEIALNWRDWREQFDAGEGDTEQDADPGPADGAEPADAVEAADAAEPADAAGQETEVQPAADDAPDAEKEPKADDTPDAEAAPDTETRPAPSHPGVLRVLEDLQGYLDNPPPPGRIRSTFASEDARLLRADGPGWSLVARTDDMAFVLLDDEPGDVIPLRRGDRLPGLLAALDDLAARPS